MRANGQVRFIGVSTMLPDLPTYLDWGVFDVMQIPYSALERGQRGVDHPRGRSRHGHRHPRRRGAGRTGQRPGIGRALGDLRACRPRRSCAKPARADPRSVLRYTLSHPHAHTIIVGTTRLEHLQENIAAALRGPLPEDTYAEAQRRLDRVGERPAPAS